jgi:flagellar biosynthesis protein FlhB
MNEDKINKEEGAQEKQERKNLKEGGNFFNSRNLKLALLFLVGFLLGIMFKTQALKSFTTGFEDYKISEYKSDFVGSAKPESDSGKESNKNNSNLDKESKQENGNVEK